MRVRDMFLSLHLKLEPRYFDVETGTGCAPENFDAVEAWNSNYGRLTPRQKETWDAHYDSVGQSYVERSLQGKELAYWKYQRYMKKPST